GRRLPRGLLRLMSSRRDINITRLGPVRQFAASHPAMIGWRLSDSDYLRATEVQAQMREILRTNDIVVLSYARDLLEQAGLQAVVADAHISAMEGSIGAFPRRLLVADPDQREARRLLQEAGLGEWLIAP